MLHQADFSTGPFETKAIEKGSDYDKLFDGFNRPITTDTLFGQPDDTNEIQSGLGLDDGSGLRVVSA